MYRIKAFVVLDGEVSSRMISKNVYGGFVIRLNGSHYGCHSFIVLSEKKKLKKGYT